MNDLNKLEQCNLDNIIGKSICQMWVGNAVAVSWWDDIWLSESLSLFLSQYCLSQIADKVINLIYIS